MKETIDTKAIEEKALNHFKSFIEDSKVISQFIADNDKEPCWDGHLYLYADGIREKEYLQGGAGPEASFVSPSVNFFVIVLPMNKSSF